MNMKSRIKVVTNLEAYERSGATPLVLALGNFDGVHVGHQALFRMIRSCTDEMKGEAAVLTFHEHPQRVLHATPSPLLLTGFKQKLSLMGRLGIDLCFVARFTHEFAGQGPEEFVRKVLVERLGVQVICMGFNARFGHDRAGDVHLMHRLGESLPFRFLEAGPVELDNVSVSSTFLRLLITKGDLERAGHLLGRRFSAYGTVVRGSGRGREIGFPTANLSLECEVFPPRGVYAVLVHRLAVRMEERSDAGFLYEDEKAEINLKGVLNYGVRPTFGAGEPVAEVHLLDSHEELLGETLEVVFVERIRDEKKFASVELLRRQIEEDVIVARRLLAAAQTAPDDGNFVAAKWPAYVV